MSKVAICGDLRYNAVPWQLLAGTLGRSDKSRTGRRILNAISMG